MSESKTLTLRELRELARKHLGRGHSRLKTKDELVEALREAVPELVAGVGRIAKEVAESVKAAAEPVPPAPKHVAPVATPPAAKPVEAPAAKPEVKAAPVEVQKPVAAPVVTAKNAEPAVAKPEVKAAPAAAAKAEATPAKAEVKAAPVVTVKTEAAPAKAEMKAAPAMTAPAKPEVKAPPVEMQKPAVPPAVTATKAEAAPVKAAQPVASEVAEAPISDSFFARRVTSRPTQPRGAEPVLEGFFVARVAGVREARRHRLLNGAGLRDQERFEESLGELPAQYAHETAVLLARDPTTVFFFWDFHPAARRLTGAPAIQLLLRVYEGGRVVREQAFSLEAKSFYVQGLEPGHTYRIEAFARTADGRITPLHIATNPVTLPSNAPSSDLTVQMMRVPWAAPLARHRHTTSGATGHLDVTAATDLPSSMSGRRAPQGPGPDEGFPPHLREGIEAGALPSSVTAWRSPPPHLSEGVASEHLPSSPAGSSWAPRTEQVPTPLDLPPHLELPSSHIFRMERGEPPSSPHPRSRRD